MCVCIYMCVCVHICVYVYIFFFKFFSIIGITRYWIEFPVLYSRALLFIYFIYSTVYLVHPKFLIYPSPPPLSPLVTVSLFPMSGYHLVFGVGKHIICLPSWSSLFLTTSLCFFFQAQSKNTNSWFSPNPCLVKNVCYHQSWAFMAKKPWMNFNRFPVKNRNSWLYLCLVGSHLN